MKIVYALMLTTIFSCKRNNIESKIADRVEDICTSSSCTIDMENLTDFSWDKMYVFKYTAPQDEVINVVGSIPERFTEFTRKIIFTSNGKIVYSEEGQTDISGLVKGEVVFDIPDSVNFKSYEIEKAIFKADKKEFERGYYYELTQIGE